MKKDISKAPLWTIKRHIIEFYQIQAFTRKEAMENCCDPYEVRLLRETCIKYKNNA